MNRIGMGIIGVGRIGTALARVVAELPNAEILAVADANEERVQEVADCWNASAYVDYRELLAMKDINAVIIATPDQLHLAPTLAAVEAGKHLFIEKPLATVVSEGEQIIAAAKQANLCLMVGHCLRFDPRYTLMRQTVAEGGIGEIIHIYSRHSSPLWTGRRIAGRCSVAFFLGIHDIDMMNWVTGSRVVRVFAKGHSKLLSDLGVDDTIMALLTFENGVIATLETCWALQRPFSSWMFDVTGTEGVIHLRPKPEQDIIIHKGDQQQRLNVLYSFAPLVQGKIVGVYKEEVRHFVDCVVTGGKPCVTGEDGLAAVVVAEAIERSLETGMEIIL